MYNTYRTHAEHIQNRDSKETLNIDIVLCWPKFLGHFISNKCIVNTKMGTDSTLISLILATGGHVLRS